jgi:hypothetical protein
LHALGGATVILITASGGRTVAATFKGLRPGGVSIVVGVGPEPIEVNGMDLRDGGGCLAVPNREHVGAVLDVVRRPITYC